MAYQLKENEMTDRELLEMAAKPIGGFLVWHTSKQTGITKYFLRDGGIQKPWNPLEHDGDALRLAVKLKLLIDGCSNCVQTMEQDFGWFYGDSGNDCSKTRRAIVRAAAEIGKAMK
jgi:hypothetical protein